MRNHGWKTPQRMVQVTHHQKVLEYNHLQPNALVSLLYLLERSYQLFENQLMVNVFVLINIQLE
jgi:hypothetical protein